MARIYTDGAEAGDVTFWSSVAGNVTASATNPGNGTYAYRLISVGATPGNATKSFTAIAELYFRVRAYLQNGASTIVFRNSTTALLTLTYDTVNARWNITTATTGNTGNNSWLMNKYQLLEIYYKIANAGGVIQIKIDGIVVFTFNGDTQPGAATNSDNVIITGVGNSVPLDIDDLAMNDVSGASDNSWCGDGKIIAFVPNGNGDSSQWLNSSGTSVNNYSFVDELPPSNLEFVQASGSSVIDNYALSSYDLQPGESVLRIWATAIAKDTAAAGTIHFGVKTQSTDYIVTGTLATSFGRINSNPWTINPNTGLAWTQADLNALQSTIKMP